MCVLRFSLNIRWQVTLRKKKLTKRGEKKKTSLTTHCWMKLDEAVKRVRISKLVKEIPQTLIFGSGSQLLQ